MHRKDIPINQIRFKLGFDLVCVTFPSSLKQATICVQGHIVSLSLLKTPGTLFLGPFMVQALEHLTWHEETTTQVGYSIPETYWEQTSSLESCLSFLMKYLCILTESWNQWSRTEAKSPVLSADAVSQSATLCVGPAAKGMLNYSLILNLFFIFTSDLLLARQIALGKHGSQWLCSY